MNQNEAAARVHIDAQLKQQGWDTHNPNSVRYEVFLGDGTRADYVLCDRHGRRSAPSNSNNSPLLPRPKALSMATVGTVHRNHILTSNT